MPVRSDSAKPQAYGKTFAGVYNKHWAYFSESLASQLLSFFSRAPRMNGAPKELLDVCCGTGQLAGRFLAQGYRVVGIDLSPHMLEYAAANNRRAVEQGRARFQTGNAASFTLGETVSFAVSVFDSLNHLPDRKALKSCFAAVWGALRSPGLFVFDLNTPAGLARWNGIMVQDGEAFTFINRGIYTPGAARAVTSITGFARNTDGFYTRFSERIYNTVFPADEVLALLQAAGFRNCYAAALRDLSAAVKEPDSLERAFFVAHRP